MTGSAPNTVQITDYQAMYFAHVLSQRHTGDSTDKLASSLADAVVDLNPHQIDAALFAFQSPLSNGVILADEVGLGKTIEAGLVISQFWAERKRQILILTPANLRKQWMAELEDKFHLPVEILEGATYSRAKRLHPNANPLDLERQKIVIASIPWASNKEDDLAAIPWDLVVIDEAHRLRNVKGKQAQRLKSSLHGRKKLLLTATPLQNRLDDLWGLSSLIDEHFFGEFRAFRARYGGSLNERDFLDLRRRLKPLVQRTLRRDAREFIKYTERIPIREDFTPTDEERALYNRVTAYLQRDNLLALPSGQRHLMTMVLRKLLASSTFAIASALRTMARRLERELANLPSRDLDEELVEEYDALQDALEEWDEGENDDQAPEPVTPEQRTAMEREIRDLNDFAEQAERIVHNAKSDALISGLREAFARIEQIGAARKAIIFTESRQTQQYLQRVLSKIPAFAGGLVLFDGSNSDPKSREIYAEWRARNTGSGSRSADIRAALVEYFRDTGQIMIATEAAAEGINLQFCSLVINYDLPWNPQRIEQRIGRCHRYGQEHDVVVVNFLNKENAADQRVFELLAEKLHLFKGIFGATDEVLGALASGVDIERRIAGIYQNARDTDEINRSFQQMQLELSDALDEQRSITERKLFEHFDENVAARFARREEKMAESLDRIERALVMLARHELRDHARFSSDRNFVLHSAPYGDTGLPIGRYDMPSRRKRQQPVVGQHFRPGHPLSRRMIAEAMGRDLPPAEVVFRYGAREGRLSAVEPLINRRGWLAGRTLSIEVDGGRDDHLLLTGYADDGTELDAEQAETLLRIPGGVIQTVLLDGETEARLDRMLREAKTGTIEMMENRIDEWADQEEAKLEAWSNDRRASNLAVITRLDKELKMKQREVLNAGNRRERNRLKMEVHDLELRIEDEEAEERARAREINREKNDLLKKVMDRLETQSTEEPLFTIRWHLTS